MRLKIKNKIKNLLNLDFILKLNLLMLLYYYYILIDIVVYFFILI